MLTRLLAGGRPIFHLIGNVTKAPDGTINLEPINDASGVTYKDGIYHAWHQCCQNHWCVPSCLLPSRPRPGDNTWCGVRGVGTTPSPQT